MYVVLPVIPYPAINPILISIGPFAVRWYALAYIVGIIAGWFYARAIIASQRLWGGPAPLTVLDFDDFVIWITLGIILGGRTGYVLFYNLPLFAAHPLQIFELWNGGMSFHGGVIGCAVAIVLFAWRRRLAMLSLADVTAGVAPIGLFLGRLANFINGELWGRPADVPWAMVFPNGGPIPRHPSQLYEAALEGVVLFIVLAIVMRAGALKRPGVVTGAFALGYGVARGAEMLSLMMAFGVVSRIGSGFLADRIGGIRTLLIGSAAQGFALLFYLFFDGLSSLYVISAMFGLFQGGIVPSYAIIVRESMPASQAATRVGLVILASVFGMSFGGWVSGVIFDSTGSYAAAFLNGLAWNALNVAIMVGLLIRSRPRLALA